ncbi:MAG: hypothetical protein K0Q66_2406 [Chitinophagaceae bacterium]|jgi:hypothetical protein|nr:hypothetical protein [Chitinophagaceae bacterium]
MENLRGAGKPREYVVLQPDPLPNFVGCWVMIMGHTGA